MMDKPLAVVVDDIEANRILAMSYLEMLGWGVQSFDNAAAVLEYVRDHVPTAMLIDIRMPGMSGDQLVRILKTDPRMNTVRLVGYTAHALPDEIAGIRACGFDEVLTKPVLMADMRRVFSLP